MSKSAVAKASTIVYFGPSDTLYCRVGSIDANETVEVHAKELNYYYITYTAGSTKKRGFVPVGSFVNESGLPTAAMFNSGCLGVCTAPGKTPVYYGPNSSGFASVGTISHSETFTVFLPAVNDWYYIEYSTSGGAKRGFIPISIVRNLKGILARTNTAKSVYAGPKTSYALLGGLSQYEYCVLVAYGVIDSTAWFQAEYSAGGTRKRGYIQDDNLTRIGNGVAPYSVSLISTYATMSANAVVFAGPSTLYSNIGRVAEDEIIMPVREENILSNTFKLLIMRQVPDESEAMFLQRLSVILFLFPIKWKPIVRSTLDHLQTFMPQLGVFRQTRVFDASSKSWIISALTILQEVY